MLDDDNLERFHSSVIPSSFRLGGLNFDIKIANNELNHSACKSFSIDANSQTITLNPGRTSREILEQNYFRELVRLILHVQGHDDLENDRGFVNSFSCLLHQAIITSKGWLDPFATIPEEFHLADEYEYTENPTEFDEPSNEDESMASRQELHDDFHDEYEAEQQHLEECSQHGMEFISYAEDWARSDDDGWFYDDDN